MFYKFMSVSSDEQNLRLRDIIKNSMMYYSDWTRFNDIGEGAFNVDPTEVYTDDNKFNLSKSIYDKIIQNKRNYSVLCSTTNRSHAMMWALYANEHRGICIGFTPQNSSVKINVNYSRIAPTVRPGVATEITNELLDEQVELILGTKSADFSSESEVRFLIKDVPNYYPVKINEIIIGSRADKNVLRDVKLYCRDRKIDIYKAEQIHGDYDLEMKIVVNAHSPLGKIEYAEPNQSLKGRM